MSSAFHRLFAKALLSAVLALGTQTAQAKTLGSELLLPEPSADTTYLLPISQALDAGDLIRAEALVRARLDAVPEDAVAWEVLGVTLALRGDAGGADAAYAKAIELEPARLSAWVKRGDLAEAAGKPAEALAYWNGALEVVPTYAPAHQRLGTAYAETGDLPQAITHLEAALSGSETPEPDVMTDLAFVYNRAGRPGDTLALLATAEAEAETDAPVEARVMLALGNAHAQSGATDKALARYQRGLDAAPEDMALLKAKGALLVEVGNAAEAAVLLEKPAATEPVDAFSNLQYARALLALGTPVEAIAAAERAAGAGGGADISRQALSVAARGHLLNGDVAGATGTTARLVALLPDDPAAWREHAAISGATGQYEAAKAIYDEALTRFPEDAELFRGRSIVNVRLSQLEAAAADATEAASLAPGWLEPRYLLGDIERARGQATAAEEAFRAALALNADHWPSMINLAALRLEAGDREEALTLAQRAVDLSGGAAAATDILQKAQAGQ
jgi:tetratricopeptide (TPR) repeat protein